MVWSRRRPRLFQDHEGGLSCWPGCRDVITCGVLIWAETKLRNYECLLTDTHASGASSWLSVSPVVRTWCSRRRSCPRCVRWPAGTVQRRAGWPVGSGQGSSGCGCPGAGGGSGRCRDEGLYGHHRVGRGRVRCCSCGSVSAGRRPSRWAPSKTTIWRVLIDTDADLFDSAVGTRLMNLAGFDAPTAADRDVGEEGVRRC